RKQDQFVFRNILASERVDDFLADSRNADGFLVSELLQPIQSSGKPPLAQHAKTDCCIRLQILNMKNERCAFDPGENPCGRSKQQRRGYYDVNVGPGQKETAKG